MDRMVIESLLRDIGVLSVEHLELVVIASVIAAFVGVGLGILGTRRPSVRRYSLVFANIMQTVPSLALFGFLIPIPLIGGIGQRTAIISLILYALLPILRNTITGIAGVEPAVREAAVAMGMTQTSVTPLCGVAARRSDDSGWSQNRNCGDYRDGHHCSSDRCGRTWRAHLSWACFR